MGRKKKILFKLNPEWMLKEPLDFEYNKYTLLDYIQKCEKSLDRFEIYPDFVELSLHLANIQSLFKENLLLLTDKKFESCDDEILLKELYPKKHRQLSQEEEKELEKTIKYSNIKLFDMFNMAKSIWNLAFDSIDLSLKKNKESMSAGSGYVFYYNIRDERLFVWEYQIKGNKNDKNTSTTYLIKLYEGTSQGVTLKSIIDNFSTLNKTEFYRELPVFEMKCAKNLPMEQTIIPIMKRKIMAYVFQIVSSSKMGSFDFEK